MPSVRVARSAALRRRLGQRVGYWEYTADGSASPYVFRGKFPAQVKAVSANMTGVTYLPKSLGVQLADTDSLEVRLTPSDFRQVDPQGNVIGPERPVAPQVGARLDVGGFLYQVTHTSDKEIGYDTEAWLCYIFKVLS